MNSILNNMHIIKLQSTLYLKLIPIEIQGKDCEIIQPAETPIYNANSKYAKVAVEGKTYNIPEWAIKY